MSVPSLPHSSERRTLRSQLLILIVLLLLSGCTTASSSMGERSGRIILWHTWSGAEEEALIRAFVEKQLETEHLLDWSCRESSGSKYLGITAKVHAQSREHIDGLYRSLSDHERVIMLI